MSSRGYGPGSSATMALAVRYESAVAQLRTRLCRHQPRRLQVDGFRPAAVAVMLLDVEGDVYLPLMRRTAQLRHHAGQICLPGGAWDPGDTSLAATALRETHEELGVDPGLAEVVGLLDDVPTTSGFVITPVVAVLGQRPHYVPNPAEVAEVFEAPLALFADPASARDMGVRQLAGMTYRRRLYTYGCFCIRGATARILESVAGVCR